MACRSRQAMVFVVLAVVLSAPVSDVISVAATMVFFVPAFYDKMRNLKYSGSLM